MTASARFTVLPVLLLTLVGTLLLPVTSVAAKGNDRGVGVSVPGSGNVAELFAVTVSLPTDVAAFDGRVLVAPGAAEVIGVAPSGTGSAFRPEAVAGGFAIGAYGLSQPNFDVVVNPLRPGRLEVRIVIDAVADASGNRTTLDGTDGLATIRISGGNQSLNAPNVNSRFKPSRGPGKAKELLRNGRFDSQDLDNARGAWDSARATGTVCGPNLQGDVNGDGCVDIADVQALNALQGQTTTTSGLSASRLSAAALPDPAAPGDPAAAAASVRTFTVTSALDTPDVAPGDGTCADSLGQCTLRAAMAEADYLQGVDTIAFNLPGPAPVTIQLQSKLPMITAKTGGVIIDGYTQPGSSPNTATNGSNAVPGIELRGTGQSAKEVGFYITSAGNTIRGFVIGNVWRGIFMDTTNAHDNRIIGNWIGFNRLGGLASSLGQYGVVLNTGANHNFVGTPDLADRNVIGNFGDAVNEYGPGTNGNTEQNNVLCMRPNGLTATCNIGVDHNFGPKDGLIGGTGANERNVFGPTNYQGIEYSHGWNPAGPPGAVDPVYQISNNRSVGNWIGFKVDGSYDPAYRSGLFFSPNDNGQGVNVYDGSNNNTIESNYIASVFDGVQVMAPNASGNIIRNNIIGRSPLGTAAPLTGWGVIVRWSTTYDVVEGNSIQNATKGGLGLVNTNNLGGPMAPAYNIRLTRNIITATNGPAIDLFGVAGPDPNDPGDADTGANTVLNTPVFTTTTTTTIAGTASNGATVEVYRASRAVGAYGLPIEYLGSAVAASNGTWSLPHASTLGDVITALQIVTDQNTSELAANVAIGASPPQAPAITSANNATFVAGTPGSFTVTTTGFPAPTIVRSGGALPSGVSFVDNLDGTGTLAGTPAAGTAGTYSFTFTATNATPPPASQNFTLTVNAAPTITSGTSATFVVGSASTFSVTTSGRPTATVGESGALPSGVTFLANANGTGTLSGTPATGTDATYPITFTASNGILPDATQNFTLTVNPPAAGAPVAQDPFNRTVANGWGSAPTGGAWTVSSASSFAVNGSTGTMSLTAGATRYGRLASVSAGGADMSAKVAIDKLPIAGNLFIYLVGRQAAVNTEYRMKVRIAVDGRVYVQVTKSVAGTETSIGSEIQVSGLTAGPGVTLAIRGQFFGSSPTTIRMRAWDASQVEPGGWATSQTDSQAELQVPGTVALRAYLASSVTNGPVVASFDDLSVVQYP